MVHQALQSELDAKGGGEEKSDFGEAHAVRRQEQAYRAGNTDDSTGDGNLVWRKTLPNEKSSRSRGHFSDRVLSGRRAISSPIAQRL